MISSGIPQLHCEPKALEKIPREVAERHVVAPLAIDGGTMLVAIADPGAVILAEDELKMLTGHPVDFVPASRAAILDAIDRGYAKLKTKARAVREPDLSGMVAAVRAFLGAAGVDTASPDLADTPARVAAAWFEDYLDGYRADAGDILSEVFPAKSKGLVVVKSIDFHSMCPHHLVPYRGVAHIAYLPKKGVVGFGKLVKVLDCFAHRLILQEEIGDSVTKSLMKHLGASGAACILDAEQACVSTRGPKRRSARFVTRSFAGALEKNARLQTEFLAACGLLPRSPRASVKRESKGRKKSKSRSKPRARR